MLLWHKQQSEMKQCLCPLTLVDALPPELSSCLLYTTVTLDSLMDRPVLNCIPRLSKCIFNILLCSLNWIVLASTFLFQTQRQTVCGTKQLRTFPVMSKCSSSALTCVCPSEEQNHKDYPVNINNNTCPCASHGSTCLIVYTHIERRKTKLQCNATVLH